MLRDPLIAQGVAECMTDVTDRLIESVNLVMENCPGDEFKHYRRAVAAIMGEILLNVLNPLYAEHPSLKPPGWWPWDPPEE